MSTPQDIEQSRAELLPCPFCGGTPELVDSRVEWFVRCNDCKPLATVIYGRSVRYLDHGGSELDFDSVDWDGLKQSAIDAWNRRAPAAPVELPEPDCYIRPGALRALQDPRYSLVQHQVTLRATRIEEDATGLYTADTVRRLLERKP